MSRPTKTKKPAGRPRRATPPRIHAVPVTGENAEEADETLPEAESEIGINEWIDPETGEPAEGQSPPRLEEE